MTITVPIFQKKVRSAQSAKMKKGDFIGSYAPYGYNKSTENKK